MAPDGAWFKSSYSGDTGNNCIEIAPQRQVHVRDSKDKQGPALTFTPDAWTDFTAFVASGQADFDIVDF